LFVLLPFFLHQSLEESLLLQASFLAIGGRQSLDTIHEFLEILGVCLLEVFSDLIAGILIGRNAQFVDISNRRRRLLGSALRLLSKSFESVQQPILLKELLDKLGGVAHYNSNYKQGPNTMRPITMDGILI
jgi:hypothetical protein